MTHHRTPGHRTGCLAGRGGRAERGLIPDEVVPQRQRQTLESRRHRHDPGRARDFAAMTDEERRYTTMLAAQFLSPVRSR